MSDPQKDTSTLDQKPPFFKSWMHIYLLVMLVFCFLVGIFYLITKIYS